MTATTDKDGKLNNWAKEPVMYITEEDMAKYSEEPYAEKAESWNSRTAMIGIVSAVISYALTGKLFFGVV